eukprot:2517733-Rhodomonas_salina.2
MAFASNSLLIVQKAKQILLHSSQRASLFWSDHSLPSEKRSDRDKAKLASIGLGAFDVEYA